MQNVGSDQRIKRLDHVYDGDLRIATLALFTRGSAGMASIIPLATEEARAGIYGVNAGLILQKWECKRSSASVTIVGRIGAEANYV